MYIHRNTDWPHFSWDDSALLYALTQVRHMQGKLLGKMEALGFSLQTEAVLKTLTIDVLKSNAIEGDHLDYDQVRSSIARRLGMDISGLVPSSRNVEGVVEMMLDATQHYDQPLTKDRLFGWHTALFPGQRSSLYKITIGDWRKDETGPMQVVSGPMGKEQVHYEAPPAHKLEKEMQGFLKWFNRKDHIEPVIKAGLAHLWFVTIHPFDDGNGRIARTIADMQLARTDRSSQRYYSLSAQIEQWKNQYYDMLEQTQKGSLDVTHWLLWFLECLLATLNQTDELLAKVLAKASFWRQHQSTALNERQRYMVNKLLDDFFGKLTTSKWAKMAKCSQDTALRDIQDLIEKEILIKDPGGGRSTSYGINLPPEEKVRLHSGETID